MAGLVSATFGLRSAPAARRGVVWRAGGWAVALLVAAAPVLASDRFDEGLFWRVEGPGGAAGYVFGTIHLTDERVTALPAALEAALAEVEVLALELTLTQEETARLAQELAITEPPFLDEQLGSELFAEITELAEARGLPSDVLRYLRAPIVSAYLALSPDEVARQMRGEPPLDLVLKEVAEARGVPVVGLETVAEQLAVFDFLDSLGPSALIRETLDYIRARPDFSEAIVEAWLAEDVTRVLDLMAEQETAEGALDIDTFVQRVVIDRNHEMAARMAPLFAEGPALIAIGALHLPGEEGVLALLEAEGYAVTREPLLRE